MISSIVFILVQSVALAPTPEAVSLGIRLARAGTLATVIPLQIEKDLDELAMEDPSLSIEEKAQLSALGRANGQAGLNKLMIALGSEYAQRLSLDDLQLLVAQAESSAARRRRAVEPVVMIETMKALGTIDLKKNIAHEFCLQTGKLCQRD